MEDAIRKAARQKRYHQTPAGRERYARYVRSTKGQQRNDRRRRRLRDEANERDRRTLADLLAQFAPPMDVRSRALAAMDAGSRALQAL